MKVEVTKPTFHDEIIICADCNRLFTFSAQEAEFFWSKQLSKPKRCYQCRKERRSRLVPDRSSDRW